MSRRQSNTYGKPDAYAKKAKEAGFPARSVFKLEEIDRRVRILKGGQRVVDLGAAPGSWSLYACKVIGQSGRLLAIDLSPLKVSLGPNARVVEGDALDVSADVFREQGPFDVVLSDMAPATTGARESDQWKSYELCLAAIEVAAAHGAPGCHFVGKIFMSPDYEKARARMRQIFDEVRTLRPESVRKNSFEVFLVGLRKKA